MDVINNFISLFNEVWRDGVSGASFTDIIISLIIFQIKETQLLEAIYEMNEAKIIIIFFKFC